MIIKNEWESVIRNGDGDLRNFTYITPTWRGLNILNVKMYPGTENELVLNKLSLDAYSAGRREEVKLIISSDENGLVGGRELLSAIGKDGTVNLRHLFAGMILDVALKNGLVEEVRSATVDSFLSVGC